MSLGVICFTLHWLIAATGRGGKLDQNDGMRKRHLAWSSSFIWVAVHPTPQNMAAVGLRMKALIGKLGLRKGKGLKPSSSSQNLNPVPGRLLFIKEKLTLSFPVYTTPMCILALAWKVKENCRNVINAESLAVPVQTNLAQWVNADHFGQP